MGLREVSRCRFLSRKMLPKVVWFYQMKMLPEETHGHRRKNEN